MLPCVLADLMLVHGTTDISNIDLERGPTDDWSDDDRSTMTSDTDVERGLACDWSTDTADTDPDYGPVDDAGYDADDEGSGKRRIWRKRTRR